MVNKILRRRNMESNSRTPVLEMNEKEKETVHQKKWALNLFLKFCGVSDKGDARPPVGQGAKVKYFI